MIESESDPDAPRPDLGRVPSPFSIDQAREAEMERRYAVDGQYEVAESPAVGRARRQREAEYDPRYVEEDLPQNGYGQQPRFVPSRQMDQNVMQEYDERSLPDPPLEPRPPTIRTRASNVSRARRRESALTVRDMERAVDQWQQEAAELRQLLDDSAEQLMSEKQRSEELESKLRGADAKFIAHDIARQKAEMESAKLQEETRRYKLQLEVALREIQNAQQSIDNADAERDRAEEAAARARDRERQLVQTIQLREAREAGLREGRREGVREGIARGRAEGRTDERGRALRAFDDFLERNWPDGIPSNVESPRLRYGRRDARDDAELESPNGRYYSARDPNRPIERPTDSIEARMDMAAGPSYSIPNRVPPATMRNDIPPPQPIPVNVGSQQQYIPPQQAYVSPQQAYAQPQQTYVTPQQQAYVTPQQAYVSRSRAGSVGRGVSPGPQLPGPPRVPDVAPMVPAPPMSTMVSPMNLAQPMMISPGHSRPHTPVAVIPDGYVPVVRSAADISLPPPHEVQPTPGVLPQTQDEADRIGEVSYDLSRHPSRMSMRSAAGFQAPERSIISPAPQRVLDPANIFETPDRGQGTHSLDEIRQSPRGSAYRQETGGTYYAEPRDVAQYETNGSEYGRGSARGVPTGRLSRISERRSEHGEPSPGSLRYAAARALPASRAPTVFSGGREQSAYGSSAMDRERMRYALRNSDPEVVEEMMSNNNRSAGSGGSARSGFSHVRRPSQIVPPAPLDPAARRAASRASMRSSSGPPTTDWRPGHRRRGTSVTSRAPTILVQPPSDPNSPARRRSMVAPDIPDIPNTPTRDMGSPDSDRTVRPPSAMSRRSAYDQPAQRPASVYDGGARAPSRAASVRQDPYAQQPIVRPASRAGSVVPPVTYTAPDPVYDRSPSRAASVRAPSVREAVYAQAPPPAAVAYDRSPSRASFREVQAQDFARPASRAASVAPGGGRDFGDNPYRSRAPSVAPSVRNGLGYADPAAVPLPMSTAPSFAPLPPDNGYGSGSAYQTPAAANFALPPSANRSEFGRSPGRAYEDLPNPYSPVDLPPRPPSRAMSMVASPTPPTRPMGPPLSAGLPPPGRPVSRAGSMRAPGTNRSYYPPLPDAGGTEWGSPEEQPRGRPLSRAPSRAATVHPPGTARSFNYPALPAEGGTEWGTPVESSAGRHGGGGFVPPPTAQKSSFYDAAPQSDDGYDAPGPSRLPPRSQSRTSMRSQRSAFRDNNPAANEVDMAFLANGRHESVLAGQVPSRPASRASVRSALKKTPRFNSNVVIEDEPGFDLR